MKNKKKFKFTFFTIALILTAMALSYDSAHLNKGDELRMINNGDNTNGSDKDKAKVNGVNPQSELCGASCVCGIAQSDEDLKKILTPEQYRIIREKGTEAPFKNAYWNNKKEGLKATHDGVADYLAKH